MAKKTPEYETMGQVLDAFGIKRTTFGESVGWKNSSIPMKLNRQRNWTVQEYEKALALAERYNLPVTREDMARFATRVA
jgi:hypothetical protein